MPSTRRGVLEAITGAALLGFAGCTGDGTGGTPQTPAGTEGSPTERRATTTGGEGGPTVQVGSHPDLGEMLVGPKGMTLYMYGEDERHGEDSACTGACAETWPPLTINDLPSKGEDVTAEVGAFSTLGGAYSSHVTANGWPLYRYRKDEAPGDAKGQGVDDHWVLAPDGTPIESR